MNLHPLSFKILNFWESEEDIYNGEINTEETSVVPDEIVISSINTIHDFVIVDENTYPIAPYISITDLIEIIIHFPNINIKLLLINIESYCIYNKLDTISKQELRHIILQLFIKNEIYS